MVQISLQQLESAHVAAIRALSSLTKRDGAVIRATVRVTGNLFRVDEHDDYDGYLSFLLTPLQEAAAGFLVCGRAGAVDLAELRGDNMVALGRFPSIGAAMLTLRPSLECDSDSAMTAQQLIDRHGSDADLHAAMRADADDGDRWRAVIRAIDRSDDIS